MDSGLLKKDMLDALAAVEILAKAFDAPTFEIYLLGGAGCVLAGYLDRATRDFDIIDLDYSASLGLVMKPLEPFDLIDPALAALAPDYKKRAVRLTEFEYLQVYVLSREDVILSKLPRFNERDARDIREILPAASLPRLLALAEEILAGEFSSAAKSAFVKNLARCMEENDVPDYVHKLEKLRGGFQ